MMVMVWSLRFSGLLAPNQWRHHLIHLRDVSGQRASKTRYQYRVFIFPPSQPASQPDRDNTDLRTENISSLELFCYSKIQTFLIRPRLEVYLVEFDRRCGKSNTLLRKGNIFIKTQIMFNFPLFSKYSKPAWFVQTGTAQYIGRDQNRSLEAGFQPCQVPIMRSLKVAGGLD